MTKNYTFSIALVFVLCFSTLVHAQKKEKIKGNRNVITKNYKLNPFTTIDLKEDLEIVLVKGTHPNIEITADENLHDVLLYSVDNDALSITTTKNIKSKKELKVFITITDTLQSLTVKDDAEVSSLTTLTLPFLDITANNNSRLDLKLEVDSLQIHSFGKSKGDYQIKGKSVFLDINESSKLEGNIYVDSLSTMMQYGSVKLAGQTKNHVIKVLEKGKFLAPELETKTVHITASEQAKIAINATESATIDASGSSEVYIYNAPTTITILRFADEATLYKKDIEKKGFLGIF